MGGPDAGMMAGPERLARFLETADAGVLEGVFSDGADVTILENFPPHLFRGQQDLARWRELMASHVGAIRDLRHTFGEPQDFRRTGEAAYFVLPTQWTGAAGGKPFTEHGGWSFLLVEDGGGWRIKAYGWSVTSFVQAA